MCRDQWLRLHGTWENQIIALIKLWLDNWNACKHISSTKGGVLQLRLRHPDNAAETRFSPACIRLSSVITGQFKCACATPRALESDPGKKTKAGRWEKTYGIRRSCLPLEVTIATRDSVHFSCIMSNTYIMYARNNAARPSILLLLLFLFENACSRAPLRDVRGQPERGPYSPAETTCIAP